MFTDISETLWTSNSNLVFESQVSVFVSSILTTKQAGGYSRALNQDGGSSL